MNFTITVISASIYIVKDVEALYSIDAINTVLDDHAAEIDQSRGHLTIICKLNEVQS